MRYRVLRNITIRSENAAKPSTQQSRFMVDLIRSLSAVNHTVDYGCGKLRYYNEIRKSTVHLSLVDSTVQTGRIQKIFGNRSSIAETTRGLNSVEILNLKQFMTVKNVYDRAFCINVLSVVPIRSVANRIISRIYDSLKHNGEGIFVIQYRNSDFSRMKTLHNAKEWRGGILLKSLRGYSYYALVSPPDLLQRISDAGFVLISAELNDGSIYVRASKPSIKDEQEHHESRSLIGFS